MSSQIIFRPPAEIVDPTPVPTELLVAAWIARRARVSVVHAAVVAGLAGFGQREAR